jgi:hypothetical protein
MRLGLAHLDFLGFALVTDGNSHGNPGRKVDSRP